MKTKFEHLSHDDRVKIEAFMLERVPKARIARHIGCCLSTLYNELRRGTVSQYAYDYKVYYRYSAAAAQRKYDLGQAQKGACIKLRDRDFLEKIEAQVMRHKYSPYAALQSVNFETSICLSTLYNYIKRRYFKHLRMMHCPAHCSYKPRRTKMQIQKQPKGRSIDTRTITREDFGNWEMDTVIGVRESSPCLLVLIERTTRFEIVRKISGRTQLAVSTALDELERDCKGKFPKLFKTITCDNGCEFLDYASVEKSCRRKKPRTILYFCHPYSSFERGSNENANRMIRRFIPKGRSMTKYSIECIAEINSWINDYPRNLFHGKTAAKMFKEKLFQLF